MPLLRYNVHTMLEKISKLNKKYPEGKLISFKPADDYKSWTLVMQPCEFSTEDSNVERVELTFEQCFRVEVNSLHYQLNNKPQRDIRIIAWVENEPSTLLKEALSWGNTPLGNPEKLLDLDELHEFHFQGFKIGISILCKKVTFREEINKR